MRVYSYTTSQKPSFKKKRFFKRKPRRGFKRIALILFRLFALGIVAVALLFLYYSKDLPDPNKLLSRDVPESTKIFARDGSLLYEIHGEVKRTQISLDQIPDSLKNATIAVEDKDFYKHHGVVLTSIIRAGITDILTGSKRQGGSTITQQFVKNAVLSANKSWDRKVREAILSLSLEARFSKDQILTFYLNEIPYGRNAYGIEAAAQSYFGKSAKNLDLAQSAYLAALPQAPTYYSPLGPNRAALDGRKNLILNLMKDQGYISQDQKKQASEEKVDFLKTYAALNAPHFVLMVQDYLANKYGETTLQQGGLKVYTTLDPRLQQIAEKAVKDGVDKASKKYNANNAALVAIDPKTGQILAMVGSKDYFADSFPAGCAPGKNCLFEPNVNVALSQRQPGSSFKPYVYGTAFKSEFKYSPASMLIDVPTDFGAYGGKNYKPGNYSGQNYGPLPMRKTLAGSLNIPAVKTLALVGVEKAVQTAHDMGITSPLSDCGLALVLGGCEVRLLDHVAAYSVIANEGVKNPATAILKIEDKNGAIVEQYQPNPKQVLDPQAAYELISIMTDNDARSFIFGANSPLILPDRIVAAKTGTTQNWHDGWTLGFTPSLAAGVWTGNNDGTLLKKNADGVVVAAPIWHNFMAQALTGTPAEDFAVPPGITKVVVDDVSGKLPTQFTPSTKTETFASYAAPKDSDNVHIQVAIDSATGQPADSLTPPERITYKVYTIFHSEKPDNPNWENPVVAWALANGYSYPSSGGLPFIPPTPAGGNGLVVNIVEPANDATLSALPFQVAVSASALTSISRVDLFIDGQFLQSLTSAPYTFNISQNYADGAHTLAVKAVDSTGAAADTSINITLALNSPLLLVEPVAGQTINFPLAIIAESANLYPDVSFYYQSDTGVIKPVIKDYNLSHPADKYRYSVILDASPSPGNYKIYAKTAAGIITPKVRITVP